MRWLLAITLLTGVLGCGTTPSSPPLSHGVFFSLEDPADASELVEDCTELVLATEGVLAHAVGPRVVDLDRPVNDQAFEVGLWILFRDRAAHDTYQVSAAHVALIESWGGRLAGARVFDHLDGPAGEER